MTLRADAKRKDLAKFLGNEYSVLQVIAQDLENTLKVKNPKKENMTGE